MTARGLHRGTMLVIVLLLGYWVVSGLILAVYDATDASQGWAVEGGGPGARLVGRDWQPLPPLASLAPGITCAIARLQGAPASVRLYQSGGVPRIEFAPTDGDRSRMQRFDARTAQPLAEYVAPDPAPGSPLAFRTELKAWHRGNVAGLAGQAAGILTGGGALLLAVSGICLFVSLYRARRRTGRTALFWNGGSLWYRLHRAVALVAAVFVLNVFITGMILGAAELQLHLFLDYRIGRPPYPRPGAMPPRSDAALRAPLWPSLQAAARLGAGPLLALEMIDQAGTQRVRIIRGGSVPAVWSLEVPSGRVLVQSERDVRQQGNGYFADWHQIVKRLHRADIFGSFAGRYLDIATGAALAYLLVSGLVMYTGQYARRRRAGHAALFWR